MFTYEEIVNLVGLIGVSTFGTVAGALLVRRFGGGVSFLLSSALVVTCVGSLRAFMPDENLLSWALFVSSAFGLGLLVLSYYKNWPRSLWADVKRRNAVIRETAESTFSQVHMCLDSAQLSPTLDTNAAPWNVTFSLSLVNLTEKDIMLGYDPSSGNDVTVRYNAFDMRRSFETWKMSESEAGFPHRDGVISVPVTGIGKCGPFKIAVPEHIVEKLRRASDSDNADDRLAVSGRISVCLSLGLLGTETLEEESEFQQSIEGILEISGKAPW